MASELCTLPGTKTSVIRPILDYGAGHDEITRGFDIYVLDKVEHKDAVSILEKTPFSNKMVDTILSSDVEMELQFNNDIYSQFLCKFPEEINFVKNTLIYPATEKHLNKYSAQRTFLVTETPDIYQKVTLPFIEEQAGHLQVKYAKVYCL